MDENRNLRRRGLFLMCSMWYYYMKTRRILTNRSNYLIGTIHRFKEIIPGFKLSFRLAVGFRVGGYGYTLFDSNKAA